MTITFEQLQQNYKFQILELARQYGASDVRVFGSVVRHDNTAESDIDFLINFDNSHSLTDLCSLRLNLVDVLGHEVDVIPESWLRSSIKQQVIQEARTL